ncbi:MAG TPA: hypothetical protein VGG69_03640 [Rhizomicrobium sp.]|jgi:hypothetical protein
MDKAKLLGDLEALGERLIAAKYASADDMATGMGTALLALAELLKVEPQAMIPAPAEPASGNVANAGFKAKSSRW